MAYNAPSTISTGDLITAAKWNADVSANPIAIYAGALSVTSQAVGDILYASSTTQFARVAAVATGQVLTSAGTGTVPAYSATPALTSVDMGGTTVYGSRAITVDTGGALNVVLASSAGDDFTVDTDKLVVSGDTGYIGIGTAAPDAQLVLQGAEGIPAQFHMYADEGDDNADKWRLVAATDGTFTIVNAAVGGSGNVLTIGSSTATWYPAGGTVEAPTIYGTTAIRAGAGDINGAGIGFGTDTDTGFILAATNTIGVITGGAERVRINSTGVGIGTSSPGAKLDLYNGAMYISTTGATTGLTSIAPTNVVALITAVGQSDGGMRIDGMSSATTVPFMIRGIFGSTNPTDANVAVAFRAGRRSGTDIADLAAAETGYQFQTAGGVAQLTILGSGNVGIGTATPGQLLDVNGTVVFSGNTAGKNTFEFSTHASNEGRLRIKNVDTDTVQIRAGGDSYFNGGDVGIGTAAPDHLLDVEKAQAGTDTTIRIGNRNDTGQAVLQLLTGVGADIAGGIRQDQTADGATGTMSLFFGGSSQKRMTFDTSGNVGIGTTSPGSLLDLESVADAPTLTITSTIATGGGVKTGGVLNFEMQGGTGEPSQTNDTPGVIAFEGQATDYQFSAGYINSIIETGGSVGRTSMVAGLSFFTKSSGAAGATEKLRISGDGRGLSQFTAKAWIKFNGTGTIAITDSHNYSSIADNGVGDYTLNFTNNMANTDYCINTHDWSYGNGWSNTQAVGSYKVTRRNESAANIDPGVIWSLVFGD